jgi:hypothetical protein
MQLWEQGPHCFQDTYKKEMAVRFSPDALMDNDDFTGVCTCWNPQRGFDCVCKWVREHPGDKEYSCEFCGVYTASAPRCNKCSES